MGTRVVGVLTFEVNLCSATLFAQSFRMIEGRLPAHKVTQQLRQFRLERRVGERLFVLGRQLLKSVDERLRNISPPKRAKSARRIRDLARRGSSGSSRISAHTVDCRLAGVRDQAGEIRKGNRPAFGGSATQRHERQGRQEIMIEETQAAEAEEQAHRWGRAEWGPFALLVGHVAFTGILSLIVPSLGSPWDFLLKATLMGVLISQPLLCALWAALAPAPLITRIPTALASFVLLGFCSPFLRATLPVWNSLSVIYFSLFVFYWVGLTIKRRNGKGSLSVLGNGSTDLPVTNRFSLKYLLFWTTVVAILLMIGRSINVWEGGISREVKLMWDRVGFGILFVGFGIYSLLFLPVFASGMYVLKTSKRFFAGAAKISFCLLLSYVILTAIVVVKWKSSLVSDILIPLTNFYLGATLAMALSAAVLRYSGYRITRDNKATV